ncbi:acyl carrier protein [Paraburkholderia kururiensis]|uniref:acyl carrier protein n=1 Tax=Paraburkholderia kururiensis TaxID=984307 RepID=UPI0003635FDD|nr:acyl carrier protein [Paraburkholderia kururiensis]
MSDQLQTAVVDGTKVTTEKILAWVQEWTEANHLKVPTDLDQTFAEAGFDSMHSVELAFFLEERLKIKIDETVLFDYPTFASLAEHLLSRIQPADAGASTTAAASGGPAVGSW